ncbi:hypothetical protein ACNKHM_26880 [Shigella sonnei]
MTPGELTASPMTTVISMMKMRNWTATGQGRSRRKYQLHAGVDARRAGAAGAAGVV